MYQFIGRYGDLIIHLFDENNWNSLAELSAKTGYSKSTIWRDLEFLETILPDGWEFEKDEVRGIYLKKPKNGTFESLLGQIRSQNEYFQILMFIIMNNGVDITQITEKVHISRSTAYRHLEKLKQMIEQEGVSLTISPFKLEGEEKGIRRFIVGFLEFMAFDPESVNAPKVKHSKVKEFQTTLLKLGDKYSVSFRTGALQRLTLYMFISNLRMSMGYFVEFPSAITMTYINNKFVDFSKELVHFMVKCPTRDIQLQEIYSYVVYLMSEERPSNRSEYLKFIRSILNSKRGEPVVKTFNILSEYIGFNLSEDETFLFYYFKKLRRMLIEVEFGIGTGRGPLLQYISYFNTNRFFKIVEEITTKIFIENNMNPKEIDILDIFLLIQSAILRKKNQFSIKGALVCRSYIEKEYIWGVLHYHFGNKIELIKIDAYSSDLRFKYDEFDLIITTDTRNLQIEHVPTIMISAVPSPSELNKIHQFINQKFFDQFGISQTMIYPYTNKSFD